MRSIGSATLIALVFATAAGWADRAPAAAPAPAAATRSTALLRLYERHDFFALRARLRAVRHDRSPDVRFYEAATDSAFNALEASNRTLASVLAMPHLEPILRRSALALKRRNDTRLFRYRAAAADARRQLAVRGAADPAETASLTNDLHLLQALADVPPQTVAIDAETAIALRAGAAGGRCVPIRLDDKPRCYILAPGARDSMITRSDARALGLRIRPAAFHPGLSTSPEATADVTIAEQVTIGHLAYRHVVFLVVPDDVLSTGHGRHAAGALGFPVIEAMGEVEFQKGGVIRVPKSPPARPPGTLALDGSHLLAQVGYDGRQFVCRFDPDAARTVFYEPFFRRFRAGIVRAGEAHISEVDGIDGPQPVPGFRLPALAITLAGMPVTIAPADVFAALVTDPRHNYLYCDVGRDALGPFDAYTINFRSMSLVLGKQALALEPEAPRGLTASPGSGARPPASSHRSPRPYSPAGAAPPAATR